MEVKEGKETQLNSVWLQDNESAGAHYLITRSLSAAW